jgi:hypothetical protein
MGNVGIRLVWRVLRHWTEIADGGPDEVDAIALLWSVRALRWCRDSSRSSFPMT